jgi:hypothetical protein
MSYKLNGRVQPVGGATRMRHGFTVLNDNDYLLMSFMYETKQEAEAAYALVEAALTTAVEFRAYAPTAKEPITRSDPRKPKASSPTPIAGASEATTRRRRRAKRERVLFTGEQK